MPQPLDHDDHEQAPACPQDAQAIGDPSAEGRSPARITRQSRLSGEFHFILADLLDNPDDSRFIRELVGRARPFMALYHPLAGADCTSSEREARVAVRISHRHLHTVEAPPSGIAALDLRKALGTNAR